MVDAGAGEDRRRGEGFALERFERDWALAQALASRVRDAGGRVMLVGGAVRDSLMGLPGKDIDLEVYGVTPQALRETLGELGTVQAKGASFGVYGLAHSDLDIAMPRRERRVGIKHTDFDVSVDPDMSFEEATKRRDFTINAMMRDVLTGELVDCWGGEADLAARVVRHINDDTFVEDSLRVFRACQFAARLKAEIAPETLALCARMDVTGLSEERVFEELSKALLKAEKPSVFFRMLRKMGHLREYFPELEACIGVEQNPVYHPEGDVFEHTMLVVDCAAALRGQARWPLAFMLSALLHDLGKAVSTQVQPDGRITAYGHERAGVALCARQLERLTREVRLRRYVENMTLLHMRPNLLAGARSRKKKTRMLFDESVCPEDLILLSRADASGKLDAPYDERLEGFLRERLKDYRRVMEREMVAGADLIAAGLRPGPAFSRMLSRARELHFSGLEKKRALRQVICEYESGMLSDGSAGGGKGRPERGGADEEASDRER